MSGFKNISTENFNYSLPHDRIAKYPLIQRDNSKLLVWKNGAIQNDNFKHISDHIPSNSLLVFNNTRVIHARLIFARDTGAKIEIFCLEPVYPSDHQISFQQTKKVIWKCLLGNAKKWKNGELIKTIQIDNNTFDLKATKLAQENNTFLIELSWDPEFSFAEIIEHAGTLPIPPYLGRETEPTDEIDYQTVYAKNDGSVAAPTAGLHFTQNVLAGLAEKKIVLQEITLHVGAGTFQPVKSETIGGHSMHHEKVIISKNFIKYLLTEKRKIIAVGTTSVRSLESLYWLGAKLENQISASENMEIGQWEPYENKPAINVQKSLENVLDYLEKTGRETLQFSTQIIIVPGYQFRMIEGMITNFHQPKSTLLLLISAFLGKDWKKVYDFALENGFRFLSYGDSNLYLK